MTTQLKIRVVRLYGGPFDGHTSVASHQTAVMGDEIYVHNGSEDRDAFTHAVTALRSVPRPDRRREKFRVIKWLRKKPVIIEGALVSHSLSDLNGIPPWRINAWIQLLKNGVAV